MGKKRGQKDRAYLTATEWREEHGGCALLCRLFAHLRPPLAVTQWA